MLNKKKIIFIILFQSVFYNAVALSPGESYFHSTNWYRNNEIVGGEIRVSLYIIAVYSNMIEVSIKKEMTPFSQILNLATMARLENGRYVFNCVDNWGNEVFGYFFYEVIGSEKIVLFFDVRNFSDYGRNLGRLYGETHILTRQNRITQIKLY
ncbi:MAG: hypothetical protein FWC34_00210 [Bacteroidetes bacterium]|nr:hypothetical protein [Bacteroidota bacterium]